MIRILKSRAVMLAVLAGCALTSRSRPVEVRYFTPEPARVTRDRAAPAPSRPDDVARIRLGRIEPSDHLREEIVHRESPYELAPYETRRWTEAPDAYVERALERALFADRPLEEALGGRALTLEVDVLAFEEVRAPRHAGRVELRYRLTDERDVIETGVVTAERPVRTSRFEGVVAAIGAALDEATGRIAEVVERTAIARGPA